MTPKEIRRIETEIYALVQLCKHALDKSVDITTERPNVLDNIQRAAMYCAKACALREMLDELTSRFAASSQSASSIAVPHEKPMRGPWYGYVAHIQHLTGKLEGQIKCQQCYDASSADSLCEKGRKALKRRDFSRALDVVRGLKCNEEYQGTEGICHDP